MSPPGLLHAILPLALALVAPPAVAGDELLREVAAYRYGQSREPLFRLSERVRASLADPSDRREIERRLVELVESGATVEAREFACRELRLVGTASAVPALSRLLLDPQLSDAAVFALASIPAPEATDALSAALEASSGRLRVGLIHALARRGVAHPAFERLAGEDDAEAAAAATWALGLTGGIDDASRILSVGSGLETREAVLRIAERSDDAGEAVFRQLLAPSEPAAVRVAALQGIVRLRGPGARRDLAAALQDDAAPLQAEAIRLAARGEGVDLLLEATPRLEPAARSRALTALGEAGVTRALPLMVAALSAADGFERVAALRGIGLLGGPEEVSLLAERAAVSAGPEQEAAQQALARLRGPGVDEALVAAIPLGVGASKRELVRAAGLRNAEGATGALLEATASSEDEVRIEALRALRRIAPDDAVSPMAALLRDPGTVAAERREAERTLAAVLRRHPEVPPDPAVAAFEAATTVEARVSIVSAVGQTGRDDALPFLRQALASDETALRRAAVLALTDWPTPAPAPDLLLVAQGETAGSVPVLALRGYIRLVSAPSALPPEEVAARLAFALDTAGRPEEKKAVLAALQKHACPDSLALARTLLDDPDVAPEARLAVDQIEDSLSYRRNQGDTIPNSRSAAGN